MVRTGPARSRSRDLADLLAGGDPRAAVSRVRPGAGSVIAANAAPAASRDGAAAGEPKPARPDRPGRTAGGVTSIRRPAESFSKV